MPTLTDGRQKTHVYTYLNEAGLKCFEKTRWQLPNGEKTFSIRHYPRPVQVRQRTAPGIGPYKDLLYRLPELLAALRTDQDVYWCEGEKDADAGATLGVACTTHYQGEAGMNKWQAEHIGREYAPGLAHNPNRPSRSKIHIVMDRDRVGVYIGWHNAKMLEQADVSVGLISFRVPAVDVTKADLSDHVAAGLGLAELRGVEWRTVQCIAQKYASQRSGGYGGGSLGSAAWKEAQQDWENSSWARRAHGN